MLEMLLMKSGGISIENESSNNLLPGQITSFTLSLPCLGREGTVRKKSF